MHSHRRDFLTASAACGTALLAPRGLFAETGTWNCWRGPNRDGRYHGAQLPGDLAGLTKVWGVELGDSYSGPLLSEEMVFTTETIDKKFEALVALDRSTGGQVWKSQWTGAMEVPFFAARNGSWIRSTPATNGKQIVVGGMRDVVACFDAATGKESWRVDFITEHGAKLPSFGLVCSPLIDEDSVYVQAGGAVKKLALADGKILWSTLPDDGGMSGGAFSSPIIAEIGGVRQLVVQTRSTLAGVDLSNGQVLWQQFIESFRGMNILTPVVWRNHVFTSCYGGKARLFKIDGTSVQTVWEAKAEAYMSSPLIVGDHLYLHLRNQRAACIDLQTGQETWRTTPFGGYWSMVTDGSSILALDETGELLLFAANPAEFQLLDRKQLSDQPSWAHIGLADDQVVVRRQRGLDVYRWS